MQRFFITGGAGFIGSHMADELIGRGRVTVFDNFSSGKMDYIAHHSESANFRLVRGDLGDLENLKKSMEGHDVVFHFAANPDIARSMLETDLDLREGTILTYNVLEAMRMNGIREILYSSGSGVYGDVGTTSTPENFGPLLPISMYGASKLACEGMISAFSHLYDMQGWIFRFANVVGQRQTHGVGHDFINKLKKNPGELEILGDGTQSKSYLHVRDVVEAMLYVHEKSSSRINVYNVATDDYIDVTAIAKIVIQEMGLKGVKLKYTGGKRGWKGDVPIVRFNLDKIHSLGWRPLHTSAEAVRKSIQEMLGQ